MNDVVANMIRLRPAIFPVRLATLFFASLLLF